MPEIIACSSVVEVATEQLTELSDRWFASIKNKDKLGSDLKRDKSKSVQSENEIRIKP
jgi:hypothetical protein